MPGWICCGTVASGPTSSPPRSRRRPSGTSPTMPCVSTGASCAAAWWARAAIWASPSWGRIEAALAGVQLNNDAVDNSAGVDTSDHEVNIKILLDDVVRSGDLTHEAAQRTAALDDRRGRCAGAAAQLRPERGARERAGAGRSTLLPVHERMMRDLAASGELDRELEFLPSDEEIRERLADWGGSDVAGTERPARVLQDDARRGGVSSDVLAAIRTSSRSWAHTSPRRSRGGTGPVGAAPPGPGHHQDGRGQRPGQPRRNLVRVPRQGGDRCRLPWTSCVATPSPAMCSNCPICGPGSPALDNQVPTRIQSTAYLEARRLLDRTTRWMVQTHSAAYDLTTGGGR